LGEAGLFGFGKINATLAEFDGLEAGKALAEGRGRFINDFGDTPPRLARFALSVKVTRNVEASSSFTGSIDPRQIAPHA
jgi:hypothetical protein